MKLSSALLGCSSAQLSRIAASWALSVEPGTLRRELVEIVAARLITVADDPTTWTALDASAHEVVRLLTRAGGRHEADLLARRLGGAREPVASDPRTAEIETAVGGLLDRGLLYRVFEADEQRQGVYLVMPDELLDAARRHFGGNPTVTGPAPAAEPERVARCDPATDLFVLASALRREAWGAASRGLAGRRGRSVGQILSRLSVLDGDGPRDLGRRWRFLLWLAQRAGWISRAPWPTPDADAVERLLSEPELAPARALSAGPVAADDRSAPHPESPRRRLQLDALQLLSELDDASWWSADQITSWLADGLGGPSHGESDVRNRRERERLEGQLGRWLAGRWFWLGLVHWGWDGSAWTLVAPTDALRSVTTGRPPTSHRQTVPCTLLDGLHLAAPLDGDLAGLFAAERYLALAGAPADGGARVRCYGLTPASFDRGVRLGGDADELRGLLVRLAQRPLPEVWASAIDSWLSGATRVSLAARLVLTASHEQALERALAVPAARDAIREQLSPRHALVAGDRLAALLTDLAQAGLPVEIDPGLRAEPADAGRAAALAGGVAEAAWVALDALRRLAPEVFADQRDLQTAHNQLEAVLAATLRESLGRRAASVVAAIANRRRPRASRARGRVV